MRRKTHLSFRVESLEDRLTPALALDPSFGVEGRTFITPGMLPLSGNISDIVVRPDGKIWAVGTMGSNPIVARFNANGELDTTFDGDGILPIYSWLGAAQVLTLNQIAVQADGKIVLAGTTSRDFSTTTWGGGSIYPYPYFNTDLLTMRLNADGSLDTTFGTEGRTTIDVGNENGSYSANLLDLRILGDGRIALAANEFVPVYPAFANGIDDSSNTRGIGRLSFAPEPTTPGFRGVRLNTDGNLDTSYDADGIANLRNEAIAPSYGNSNGSGAILADGSMVFTTTRTTPYSSPLPAVQELYVSAFRLNPEGARDTNFDGDGYAETLVESVSTPEGGSGYVSGSANRVHVQSNGRILVTVQSNSSRYENGFQTYSSTDSAKIVAFTANGQFDTSFANNGSLTIYTNVSGNTIDSRPPTSLMSVTLLPNDVLGVITLTPAGSNVTTWELRRYPANGIDLTLGPTGQFPTFTIPASPVAGETLSPMFLVPNGDKILIVGTTESTPVLGSRIGLIQLANDPAPVPPTANNQNRVGRFLAKPGTPVSNLDPDFGGGAPVFLSMDLGPITGFTSSTLVQTNGKILVFGSLNGTPMMARFNAEGTLDRTFDGDGVRMLTKADNEQSFNPSQISLQADGKILIVGTLQVSTDSSGNRERKPFVMRLNTNGSNDATFGDNGRVLFELIENEFTGFVTTIVVAELSNGKVQVVLGQTNVPVDGSTSTYTIRRLNADGTPDTTYDGDGSATITYNSAQIYSSIALIQPDGSVILAGAGPDRSRSWVDFFPDPNPAPINTVLTLVRVAANGTLDTTFDGDGRAELILGTNSQTDGLNSSTSASAPLVVVQADGKIVIGTQVTKTTSGYTTNPDGTQTYQYTTEQRFEIRRFKTDGSLDTTFGTNGLTVLDESTTNDGGLGGNFTYYTSLIALPDGGFSLMSGVQKTYLYPRSYLEDSIAPALVPPSSQITNTILRRLTPNGLIDLTYGVDGIVTVATEASELQPATQMLDRNGEIIISGNSNRLGIGLERLDSGFPSLPSIEPTFYVSGPNGTVEAFQRDAAGNIVSKGIQTPFPNYTGVVRVTTGDLNGDGFADTIFSTGSSGNSIRIILGLDPNSATLEAATVVDLAEVFESSYDRGISVAVGDVDGDGKDEFVAAPSLGGSGRVRLYSLQNLTPTLRADFLSIEDPAFRGGVNCAFGDMNKDGKMELVVGAGEGGGPRMAIFDGATIFSAELGQTPRKLIGDFFAFPGEDAQKLRNGATVALDDLNDDGAADLVFGSGLGGSARIYAVDGNEMTKGNTVALANYYANGDETSRTGVRFVLKDLNKDGRAELVTTHEGKVRIYGGTTLMQPNGVEPMGEDVSSLVASGIYVG